MEKEITAYKSFYNGLTNELDNITYQIGKTYHTTGQIQWGKNGFHMCIYPEDCFFFIKPFVTKVDLALVRGFGNMYSVSSNYDDRYSDMYVCQNMEILKLLTHEEIIEIGLSLKDYRAEKFIQNFKLTKEEIKLFKQAYIADEHLIKYIEYYQENKKQAFTKKRGKYYGSDNNQRR